MDKEKRLDSKMEFMRIFLKIVMWVLIIEFGCNFVMQLVNYCEFCQRKNLLFFNLPLDKGHFITEVTI